MGKLENLEEELYTTESDKDLSRRMREKPLPPPVHGKAPIKWAEEVVLPKAPYSRYMPLVLKLGLAVLAIAAIIGVAVFIFLYLGTRGSEVALSIAGRSSVESGELIPIPISIRNVSGSLLEEVELTIFLPENSILNEAGIDKPAPPRLVRKLENLESNEEVLIEVRARMFGKEEEDKEVRASLLYRPGNLRARFSSDISKKFRISSVPLALSWEIPDELSRGQDVSIKVYYASNARIQFEDLFIKLEFPPGFTFKSADPKPTNNENIWKIGDLDPGEEGTIVVTGSIDGEEGELKAFRGGLGVFNQNTGEWRSHTESNKVVKIEVSPLSIEGFISRSRVGAVSPGENLNMSVRYKNNTEFILKNISVKAFLEGDILERQSIVISKGGVLDALSRAIVWGPSSTADLREVHPGESGELIFSIQTKPRPVMRSLGDTNLTVKLRSLIEVADIPLELQGVELAKEDSLEFKVRSLTLFSAKSLYRSSSIPNTGPLPPKVGEKTTYTVQWEIRNFTNNLNGVEIKTTLPPNIKWEGVVYPSEARISYDASSGEVRWRVGNLSAGTGVLTPALTAAFQVSLTPAETDVDHRVSLTNESFLNGKDGFTGEDVAEKFIGLSTETRGDPAVRFDEYNVVR